MHPLTTSASETRAAAGRNHLLVAAAPHEVEVNAFSFVEVRPGWDGEGRLSIPDVGDLPTPPGGFASSRLARRVPPPPG